MKYIIITPSITGMGGGQQYAYNKMRAMQSIGYDVVVFSSTEGNLVINGFSDQYKYIMPEIMFQPMYYKKSLVRSVIGRMMSVCGKSNKDTIVESNDQAAALWAEMLAERIGCNHVICMITENPRAYSIQETNFYYFKLLRHELYVNALSNFKSLFHLRDFLDEHYYKAFCPICTNVVENTECALAEKLRLDKSTKICSIGRIDKPYVIPLAETLKLYIDRNKTVRFTVVFIGDTQDENRITRIKKILKGNNCELILTGSMYPIPRSLIREMDIFVSSAGSAYVTAAEGKTTIRIPFENEEPCFASMCNGRFILHKERSGKLIDLIEEGLSANGVCYANEEYHEDTSQILICEYRNMCNDIQGNKKMYFHVESIKPHGLKRSIILIIGRLWGYKSLLWLTKRNSFVVELWKKIVGVK